MDDYIALKTHETSASRPFGHDSEHDEVYPRFNPQSDEGLDDVDGCTSMDALKDHFFHLQSAYRGLQTDKRKQDDSLKTLQAQHLRLASDLSDLSHIVMIQGRDRTAMELKAPGIVGSAEWRTSVSHYPMTNRFIRQAHTPDQRLSELRTTAKSAEARLDMMEGKLRAITTHRVADVSREVAKAVRAEMQDLRADCKKDLENAVSGVEKKIRASTGAARDKMIMAIKRAITEQTDEAKEHLKTAVWQLAKDAITEQDCEMMALKFSMTEDAEREFHEHVKVETGEFDKHVDVKRLEMRDALAEAAEIKEDEFDRFYERRRASVQKALDDAEVVARASVSKISQSGQDALENLAQSQASLEDTLGNVQHAILSGHQAIIDLKEEVGAAETQESSLQVLRSAAAKVANESCDTIQKLAHWTTTTICQHGENSSVKIKDARRKAQIAILESRAAALDSIALHTVKAQQPVPPKSPSPIPSTLSGVVDRAPQPAEEQLAGLLQQIGGIGHQAAPLRNETKHANIDNRRLSHSREMRHMESDLEKLKQELAAVRRSWTAGDVPWSTLSARSASTRNTTVNRAGPGRILCPEDPPPPSPPVLQSISSLDYLRNKGETGDSSIGSQLYDFCSSDHGSCATCVAGEETAMAPWPADWPRYWEGGDPTGLGRRAEQD